MTDSVESGIIPPLLINLNGYTQSSLIFLFFVISGRRKDMIVKLIKPRPKGDSPFRITKTLQSEGRRELETPPPPVRGP